MKKIRATHAQPQEQTEEQKEEFREMMREGHRLGRLQREQEERLLTAK